MDKITYLKNYDIDYLIDYFKDKTTKDFNNNNVDNLKLILNCFIKNDYKICNNTFTTYNKDYFLSKFSNLQDAKKEVQYFKDNNINILDNFIPEVNDSLSRIKRGFTII